MSGFQVPRRALVLIAVLVMASGSALAESRTPTSQAEIKLSFAPLVKRAAPAVVNVFTQKIVESRSRVPLFNDPFFRQFFGEQFGVPQGQRRSHRQNSLGSGVIVDPRGVIVTNNHVIEGADEIRIVLSDRREYAATVEATDKKTDLAILRVDTGGKPLPYIEFRDSDDLEVGDLVLAIGNPFGVGQTVTSGIVSALARTHISESELNSFIQTDAAINPGNSGGALIAMDGRLVGINTAIFSKSGGSLGIGFAVPSNMVRAVVNGVGSAGKLVRPWLGAAGQQVSFDIATSLRMERPTGVLVNAVHRESAAAAAGVRVGDVILAVNGHEVDDPTSLRHRFATLPVGGEAVLRVWRGGTMRPLKVKLFAAPEIPRRKDKELDGAQPLAGATVANMSPALAEELGFDAFTDGVVIVRIRRGTPAARLNFKAGDFVEAINGYETKSVHKLNRTLRKTTDQWRITVNRDGRSRDLVINR